MIQKVCLAGGICTPTFLAALLLLSGAPVVADDSLEGRPVAAIEFEPSGQPLPTAELNRLLPIHPGDPYKLASVRDAMQKLYATGRYTDLQVDASPRADGVVLRFITTEAVFVGRVAAGGSPDPPNPGQLVTASKLQLGAEFADNDLRQAIENIQNRLRANGLYSATVDTSVTRDPSIEQINIDFRIDPGSRAKFDGVVVEGDPGRSQSAIIRSTKWQRPFGLFGWRPLTESRLQSGIENVRSYYQKHDHLLARVSLTNLAYDEDDNTVVPTISITPGPLVRVRVEGAKLSRGKLRQLAPMFEERSVDRSLVLEGRRNIAEYFQSKGYFDAEVDSQFLTPSQDERVVEYTVDRQERHKLSKIEILGNRYFDRATIRERMYTMPASFLRFRYGRYSQRYLDKDKDAIEDLYHSNGFRDVRVDTDVIDDYAGHKGDLGVVVKVDEGLQWKVAGLDIEGIDPADLDYIKSIVHSSAGQPFSDYNVAADRDAVLAYYFNNGYPNATFDWNQTPADQPLQVNLKFIVHPGSRIFVRKVIVNGLNITNPDLVENRIRFGEGDPVSQVRIADAQRRLYDLGIFAKVQTAVQNPEGTEESKYVLYQLEEARRYSMNVGVGAEIARIGGGVTTFDAPAGATGFAPRVSFGISRINFLGLGHTVSIQTRASTLEQRALITYYAPQFRNNDNLSVTFTLLYDDTKDVRTFAARRAEGSIQLAQRLSRANTMQYRFTYRDVFVDPNSLKINSGLIPLLSQSVRVGQAGITFVQDRRDDPTDAHKGIYQTIDFSVAAAPFGSQTSFTRLVVKNATYHRINRDVVFARSVNFGMMNRFGGLPDIPLPERFFSGGASSHRGFPDNQAGPRDPITGFPLGGKAVLMNTFELRFPLLGDNVRGVFFHDAGNVYSSVSDISFRYHQRDLNDFDYMVHAVGFGIRYRTPIGPIRADIAFGLNSPRFFGFQGDRDTLLICSAPGSTTPCNSVEQKINLFQFHFSLGQAF
jgi:outer membrane protein assembly complex protein YaeT